jgi:hypothetical protein
MSELRSKYNARKTVIDGIMFDSASESRRYQELKLLEAAGEITGLECQSKFPIFVNGDKICVYKADFLYCTVDSRLHIEDVKGFRTPVYRLKKKLIKALYYIDIEEVTA